MAGAPTGRSRSLRIGELGQYRRRRDRECEIVRRTAVLQDRMRAWLLPHAGALIARQRGQSASCIRDSFVSAAESTRDEQAEREAKRGRYGPAASGQRAASSAAAHVELSLLGVVLAAGGVSRWPGVAADSAAFPSTCSPSVPRFQSDACIAGLAPNPAPPHDQPHLVYLRARCPPRSQILRSSRRTKHH